MLAGLILACGAVTPALAVSMEDKVSPRVNFKAVIDRAKDVSTRPYKAPGQELSELLKKIGYDQWRDIRFKPARSLWSGGRNMFQVQFFHPGFLFQQPVSMHYVERSGTHHISFSTDLFDYARPEVRDSIAGDLGFAGFRVHYPVNTPKYADEIVSFLGASYFRALAKDQVYGMSARGLALNTVEDTGEEFPYFTEFWIVHPESDGQEITVYALLDSPSVAGAYEFVIRPGEETVVQVRSVLFFRKKVRKLGVSPLTSMFSYGENSPYNNGHDFRPEVHDSDGLSLQMRSGEWVWHPLENTSRLIVNAFGGGQPKGFGLMQRDTSFDHYQDLEARYERRPSVWVIPEGDWGKGHIELIQIPTSNEYNDNIGAYWVPEHAPEPGETRQYDYTLIWHGSGKRPLPAGNVTATRLVRKPDSVMFVVDFNGSGPGVTPSGKDPVADVQAFNDYKVERAQVINNTVTGGWRLILVVKIDQPGILDGVLPHQKPEIDLRAFLKDGDVPVTETWSYTCLP